MSILISMEHWPTDLPRLERYWAGESTDTDMEVQQQRLDALHGPDRWKAATESPVQSMGGAAWWVR